ncbi:MAG: hypothetical protein ABDH61_01345 [Acidilobaceae archaeon]
MRSWALLGMLLLAAVASAGEVEVFASWRSSLESLKGIVGEEVLRELERAGGLKEAILAQERALSKLKQRLETLSVEQRSEEFQAKLQEEFSTVLERLASLGVIQRNAVVAQRATSAGEWMKMAEELRESWSLKLVALEVGERLKKAGADEISAENVGEVEKITQVFQVGGKVKEFTDCLERFKEGKITMRELRACAAKVEPMPVLEQKEGEVSSPVGAQPIKREGVQFKLALFSRGVKLEPERVELTITGGKSDYAVFKDVAKLHASTNPIIFKVNAVMNGSVMGSIKVTLRGEKGEQYTISMPCAIASTDCVRIMVLIPGYDVPIEIAADKYSLDIVVVWKAQEETASGIIEIAVVDAAYRK